MSASCLAPTLCHGWGRVLSQGKSASVSVGRGDKKPQTGWLLNKRDFLLLVLGAGSLRSVLTESVSGDDLPPGLRLPAKGGLSFSLSSRGADRASSPDYSPFNPCLKMCFIDFRERGRQGERERGRENHGLLASHTRPNHGWNLQPRHVS